MGKEKLIGIYSITNKINGKVYVGQSVNVYKRWKDHKYELNKNIHHNIYIYKEHGINMVRVILNLKL